MWRKVVFRIFVVDEERWRCSLPSYFVGSRGERLYGNEVGVRCKSVTKHERILNGRLFVGRDYASLGLDYNSRPLQAILFT